LHSFSDINGSFEDTAQGFDASTSPLETHSNRLSRIDPRLEDQAAITHPQNIPGAGLQEYTSSYCYRSLNPGHATIPAIPGVGLGQERQKEWTGLDQRDKSFQLTRHLSASDNRNSSTHLDVEARYNCQSLAEPKIAYDNQVVPGAFGAVAIPANSPINTISPRSIYRPYSALFADSAAAKAHRKSARKGPRLKDSNFDTVKIIHRDYWVQKLHESIVDISNVQDGLGGDGYKRFVSSTHAFYENEDLEAAAHEVFVSIVCAPNALT
jgi:hypothetical protein